MLVYIYLQNEMLNLKQDNERLQRIVTSKSLTSSQNSLPINDNMERRFSTTDIINTGKFKHNMAFLQPQTTDTIFIILFQFYSCTIECPIKRGGG